MTVALPCRDLVYTQRVNRLRPAAWLDVSRRVGVVDFPNHCVGDSLLLCDDCETTFVTLLVNVLLVPLQQARWSPEEAADRNELLELALKSGVLSKIVRGDMAFNSEFESLKSLLTDEPSLSRPAFIFVEEYLGQNAAKKVVGTM